MFVTPWVKKIIDEDDLSLWQEIRYIVEKLPDMEFELHGKSVGITAHMLVGALVQLFPDRLQVETGSFLAGFNHSWLRTKSGNVIDVYPVGLLGGPVLYSGDVDSPASVMYKPGISSGYFQGLRPDWHRSCVQRIVDAIKQIEYVNLSR